MKKLLLALFTLPFILLGCNNNGGGHKPTPTPEQYINVAVSQVTLEELETYQIETEVLVPNTIVFYSSNNNNIASVTDDGLVTAVAPGETSINVRGGRDYFSVFITVTTYQAKDSLQVTISKKNFTLEVNDTFVLPLVVKYGNFEVHNYELSYLYENDDVVSINGTTMTALSVGATKVVATVTYNEQTASESFTVTVY